MIDGDLRGSLPVAWLTVPLMTLFGDEIEMPTLNSLTIAALKVVAVTYQVAVK